MKKLAVLLVAVVIMLSMAGCGKDSFPSEVSEYAKKHALDLLTADKLKSTAVVGKKYVVYGTITSISFYNYEKGSAELKDAVSRADDKVKDIVRAELEGTMTYYVYLSGTVEALKYEGWNFSAKMLRVNKGDEVAFIVTCEDGYVPGSYDYIITEKIWESRHSETTIEEDHDAPKGNSTGS